MHTTHQILLATLPEEALAVGTSCVVWTTRTAEHSPNENAFVLLLTKYVKSLSVRAVEQCRHVDAVETTHDQRTNFESHEGNCSNHPYICNSTSQKNSFQRRGHEQTEFRYIILLTPSCNLQSHSSSQQNSLVFERATA